jgi:hypothetical protein
VSRVYDPTDVNPAWQRDRHRQHPPTRQQRHRRPIEGDFGSPAQLANGAGRICEVPPPPGGNSERIRIVHQVGTFTAANPIEARANAISPVNTTAPALTVAPAFGGEGFSPPSLLGVFDTAPYLHNGAVPTLDALFGIGTDAALLPTVRAHWRAAPAATPTSSTPTRAPRATGGVREDDRRADQRVPAADLARTIRPSPTLPRCATAPRIRRLGTPAIDRRP